jgi:hypothetical protein
MIHRLANTGPPFARRVHLTRFRIESGASFETLLELLTAFDQARPARKERLAQPQQG